MERGREKQALQVDFKGFHSGTGAITRFVFLGLTSQLYQSISVQ